MRLTFIQIPPTVNPPDRECGEGNLGVALRKGNNPMIHFIYFKHHYISFFTESTPFNIPLAHFESAFLFTLLLSGGIMYSLAASINF